MSSSCFRVICLLHSCIDVVLGALIMFYFSDIAVFSVGRETASKLLGSTPHDQLLIKTSEALVGACYVFIGILLFMVAFVKDRDFQSFFAKGCALMHVLMAVWRLFFERKIEDVARDLPRQVVGDIFLAMSWVFFLIRNWREKYD
ncbi:hypothetical protein KP509_04G059400 [Ceratopteris richardii]|uniref:DUF7865 domain-containing protein n=2 Tax=Ceratopteris richardii TaxID=49495 RepID=A0A8T2UXF1_CERRI|nr:hypothetical protein KP509_04G059400 [Ceratopteris richardii]